MRLVLYNIHTQPPTVYEKEKIDVRIPKRGLANITLPHYFVITRKSDPA